MVRRAAGGCGLRRNRLKVDAAQVGDLVDSHRIEVSQARSSWRESPEIRRRRAEPRHKLPAPHLKVCAPLADSHRDFDEAGPVTKDASAVAYAPERTHLVSETGDWESNRGIGRSATALYRRSAAVAEARNSSPNR